MALSDLKYLPIESREELEIVLKRLRWLHTIFNASVPEGIRFHRELDSIVCSAPIAAGSRPSPLPRGEDLSLPESFHVPGKVGERLSVESGDFGLEPFLQRVNTLGLAVVQDGKLVHERYGLGNDERTQWMSNSASKFVIGILVAIAHAEGAIESFSDPVDRYWPELAGSGWDGVTIDQCLRMTSGIAFDEYSLDLWKDGPYIRLLYALASGSIEPHVVSQGSKAPPGTRAEYSSINTEALGGILVRATGKSITQYLQEKIWQPGGMEHDAYWVADTTGREMALAGLCATLRDYARLGLMMANDGILNGKQIVPAWYAQRLATVDNAHFKLAGSQNDAVLNWYQVFVPSDEALNEGDYMASGSFGQNIYVNRKSRTVVVTHSMYADVLTEEAEMYRHFMAFRAIARAAAHA